MKSPNSSRNPRRGSSTRLKAAAPILKRLLVPLDFSGESRRALPHAIAIAEKFGARITLVHVVAPVLVPAMPPALGVAYVPTAIPGLKEHAATELNQRGEKLIPRALYERSIVTTGHPGDEIIAVADRIEADMIILTSHGRSGVKRFLLGSTADQVVRHAHCPVMTVRREAAPEPERATPASDDPPTHSP